MSLARGLCIAPFPGHRARAAKRVTDWLKTLEARARSAYDGLIVANPQLPDFVAAVFDGSPFLFDLVRRDCARFLRLLASDPEISFQALLAHVSTLGQGEPDDESLMRDLRLARQEVALLIALADLGGVWDVGIVTHHLSIFAEVALSTALDVLLLRAAKRGDIQLEESASPQAGCGYFILGMGKLGAYELNYSSDIDLIAFYDVERVRLRRADEHQAFFVRLTQQVSRLLSSEDHNGFVFRVDLRLRPDPGTYPLAISTALALNYYEAVGQNWERAAFIKARPVAGDIAQGEAFLHEIAPFIWRKYLDYAAIAEIHAMKRLIEEAKDLSNTNIAGRDLKLGVGGIREIEFFVQTQQLIGGGRDQRLRTRPTLETLKHLTISGWIDADARDDLMAAYHELRRLEHRVQMVDDKQSHRLPSDPKDLTRFARFAGFSNTTPLSRSLRGTVDSVRRHYVSLFDAKPQTEPHLSAIDFSDADLSANDHGALKALGFGETERLSAIVRGWQAGRYPATRSATARARLSEITPRLLQALGASGEADATLAAFDRFLSQLPVGVQFFSLLRSKPAMLDLFTRLLSTAPRLSQDLARRPHLIDGLIENLHREDSDPLLSVDTQAARVLSADMDYGEALDAARRLTQERVFLIGVRLVAGLMKPRDAGAAYSELAETIVKTLHQRAQREHVRHFGVTPRGSSAVLALGRLGSREMTAASDLDLILLYEDPHDAMSDGKKPLYAAEYFTRLTQRLVAALSAPTGEGIAYPVDFRLRPSGNKGPLATSLSAFAEYHAREAWTWEHLALTRARIVATNSADFAMRLDAQIDKIICRHRDANKLARDVCDMRAILCKEKPPRTIWDVRQSEGGMIDIDFLSQFLILRHASEHPSLMRLSGAPLFSALAGRAILSAEQAELLASATHFYTVITQLARLCLDPEKSLGVASTSLIRLVTKACKVADLPALQRRIAQHQKAVRGAFVAVLGRDPYQKPSA